MIPYSKEFRRVVLAACDAGGGTRSVALKFAVSESWVRRIKQERRDTGKTAPLLTRRRTPKWAPYRDEIERLIAGHPDLTLKECRRRLPRRCP